MEIIAYIAAVFIGVSLGLVGSGGSIITLPVLVYLLYIDPIIATGYSLFAVGITSAVGATSNIIKGNVNLKMAFIFALPALTVTYLTRLFIVPNIPEILFTIGNLSVNRDFVIMSFFALIVLRSGWAMLKGKKDIEQTEVKVGYPVMVTLAVAVGLLSALLGAGGGFLIIPALVVVAKMPMKNAVGTSLFIIALNSLVGFTGDLTAGHEINWHFLLLFSSLSVIGIFIGMFLSKFIDGSKLKKGFAIFMFIMAGYIIFKELSLKGVI